MAQMMTKDISLEEETKYCNDEDDMIYKDENGGVITNINSLESFLISL